MNHKYLLKVRDFIKRHKATILTVAIIWLLIIIVNNSLKGKKINTPYINAYRPNKAVVKGSINKKDSERAEKLFNDYNDYCNQKKYYKAYEMLSDSCKEYLFSNNFSKFENYIKSIYKSNTKKILKLQNYSNLNNKNIYEITIMDDIETTGKAWEYETYLDKMTVVKEKTGEYKLTIQGFIESEEFKNKVVEDNRIKIQLLSEDITYRTVSYKVKLLNKTDKVLEVSNRENNKAVTLALSGERRPAANLYDTDIILKPGEDREVIIMFKRYYDDGKKINSIDFNNIIVKDKITDVDGEKFAISFKV